MGTWGGGPRALAEVISSCSVLWCMGILSYQFYIVFIMQLYYSDNHIVTFNHYQIKAP